MTYVARTRDVFAASISARLPEGPVWPRHTSSTLQRTLHALSDPWAKWATDCARFLNIEAFPPSADGMLMDWERALGLPEACIPYPTGFAERQREVAEKLARRPGAQSKQYFLQLAYTLGYHELPPSPYAVPITLPAQLGSLLETRITEFRPFMAGVSRCGDNRWQIAPPQMRFVWRVNVPGRRLTWFRCGHGGGRAGRDTHLRMRRAEDLECLFRKLKPAHTNLIFSYTGS